MIDPPKPSLEEMDILRPRAHIEQTMEAYREKIPEWVFNQLTLDLFRLVDNREHLLHDRARQHAMRWFEAAAARQNLEERKVIALETIAAALKREVVVKEADDAPF